MAVQSVQAIGQPEFINISPCNPLISKCEIKVLYVGKNRNRTFISKETATKMADTLPGTPIVGYYRTDKEDFEEHSERVTIDGTGVKFECLTKPYGFVAPDAQPWFQKFKEMDDFGNTVEREYLMVTGYLWTGQFKECQRVIDKGNNHSMELDTESLEGHWTEDYKSNIEFFIINDATFSKLCILGEDVEPCFEGSTISAPQISSSFSLDNNFQNTLYSMMKDLKSMLQGGNQMLDNEIIESAELEEQVDATLEAPEDEYKKDDDSQDKKEKEDTENNQDKTEEDNSDSNSESEEDEDKKKKKDFAKDEDDEEKKEDKEEYKKSDDSEEDDEEEDKKEEKKFSLEEYSALESKISDLEEQISALSEENASLRKFKLEAEREDKKALISDFYMLSDNDKKDVVDNIDKYSLEEIEAKLSVICFRNKINFNLEDSNKNTENVTTYNLEDTTVETLPAWLQAVEDFRNSNI